MSADAHPVLGLDAFVAVPHHVGFEVVAGLVDALLLSVPVVVELLFQSAEEPLGGRVVGAAALGAHGTGHPVAFADRDSSGPSVVAAPVGVDDRMLAGLEGGACPFEHAVGQAGVRAGADAPGDGHAVEAVDDRAEIDLAVLGAELGDVGDPQPVGRPGMEVPLDEVGGRGRVLARVRAVAPATP